MYEHMAFELHKCNHCWVSYAEFNHNRDYKLISCKIDNSWEFFPNLLTNLILIFDIGNLILIFSLNNLILILY